MNSSLLYRNCAAALLAAALPLIATSRAHAITIAAPVDVLGHLSLSDFTNNAYGTNAYKDWGNEPSITVNPLNPNQMVLSCFAYGSSTTTSGADFFQSSDGGNTWTSRFTVPAPATGVRIPEDWRFAYDAGGTLHAAVLGETSAGTNLYVGATSNPASLASWSWTTSGAPVNVAPSLNGADQPWIALAPGNKIFVAYDDFNNFSTTGVKEHVTVSTNNGLSFSNDQLIANAAMNTANPGTRIATDSNGFVYSIIGNGTSNVSTGVQHVDYYINRSRDGGADWDFNASSSFGGLLVDGGNSTQTDSTGTKWFAGINELLGSVTSIASDASGHNLYVLYGKQDASNVDRVFLQKFTTVGSFLVPSPAIPVSVPGERACLPSLTVLTNGAVIMEYDAFNTSTGKIEVHITSSTDLGLSVASDSTVYQYTPVSFAALGIAGDNRELGDYQFITSIGNTFYAAFNGMGNVNAGGINSTSLLDPFVISGTDVPEPASALLLLTGITALTTRSRRRTPR